MRRAQSVYNIIYLIRALYTLHVGCEMYSTVLYPGTVGFSTGT